MAIFARFPGLIVCLALVAPAQAEQMNGDRPVLVGKDGPDMDACGAVGKVFGLDREKDEQLVVRLAPHPAGSETDQLDSATLVWLCDTDGDWQGIVYPQGAYQDLGDCRVSGPAAEPHSYAGPCKHGWVLARYLELVAG